MSMRSVNCPQCDAPINIVAGQKHCRCTYCGSKFVVDWSSSEPPQFTRFESILTRPMDDTSLEEADERLVELEDTIAEAKEEVRAQRAEVEEARMAYQELRAEWQRMISPAQTGAYAGGLLALVVWFLVFFVLENVAWYMGLVLAVLLVLVTRGFHRQWQRAEAQAQSELEEARRIIEEAEMGLDEALARLEDCTLERELHQKEISNCRQAKQASM